MSDQKRGKSTFFFYQQSTLNQTQGQHDTMMFFSVQILPEKCVTAQSRKYILTKHKAGKRGSFFATTARKSCKYQPSQRSTRPAR